MAEITAALVKQLRESTGAGMMDCKQALVDADGDFEKAADLVRERTGARMQKRVGERSANEGVVHAYVHRPSPGLPPRVGVLLELNCETDFVAKGEAFQQLAADIAMHISFSDPVAVSEDEIDPALVQKERDFAAKQARDEGKPQHILDKIVEGKVKAFLKERALLNQPFIKDTDRTIGQLLDEFQRTSGEKITVGRFARFKIGY